MKILPSVLALFASGCLAIGTPAWSAPLTNATDVLDFATAKNDTYNSFSGDYIQTMDSRGMQMKVSGSMSFKKPSQVRMEMAMSMSMTATAATQKILIVMGSDHVLWQQSNQDGHVNVIKMDFRQIPADNPAAGLIKNPIEEIDPKHQLAKARERYDFTFVSTAEQHGEPVYVLEGTLNPNATLSVQEAAVLGDGKQRIYIGQHDGVLYKMDQLDKSGSNTIWSVDLTNVKLNPPLDDNLFLYQPPTGASIADITPKILELTPPPGTGTPKQPVNIGAPPAN